MKVLQSFQRSLMLTALATPLLFNALSVNAAALGLESARVRLPNGQVVTIDDGRNWYQDERVVVYKRYYYEPRERVYVVYNDDDHHHGHAMPHHGKHKDKKHGHFCPPGQAKKGNC